MSAPVLRTAISAVRQWTRLYTWGLPPAIRDERRAQIEADLWESTHDPGQGSPWFLPLHLTLRLVLGIPDDLGWRIERARVSRTALVRASVVAAVVCALALSVTLLLLLRSQQLPLPAAPAILTEQRVPPPPPVPPPPVPPPWGLQGAASTSRSQPLWSFGQTSYSVTGNGGAPIRIKEVRPVYPPIARDADIEGVVIIQARITEQGQVVDARANPPDSILSHAATGAVTQWEFAPAQGDRGGRNTLTVKVSFTRER